jgi:hypothetical protein
MVGEGLLSPATSMSSFYRVVAMRGGESGDGEAGGGGGGMNPRSNPLLWLSSYYL